MFSSSFEPPRSSQSNSVSHRLPCRAFDHISSSIGDWRGRNCLQNLSFCSEPLVCIRPESLSSFPKLWKLNFSVRHPRSTVHPVLNGLNNGLTASTPTSESFKSVPRTKCDFRCDLSSARVCFKVASLESSEVWNFRTVRRQPARTHSKRLAVLFSKK